MKRENGRSIGNNGTNGMGGMRLGDWIALTLMMLALAAGPSVRQAHADGNIVYIEGIGDVEILDDGSIVDDAPAVVYDYETEGVILEAESSSGSSTAPSVVIVEDTRARGVRHWDKEAREYWYEAPEDEVYLLAQLIHHEAGNQSRDGKIAVGEVVMNRVYSSKFQQNNITDIIFAPGQFEKSEEIDRMRPSEEEVEIAREVIDGELSVFDNPKVCFFRNPVVTSGIDPWIVQDWGKYPWYCYIGAHAFYTVK